MLLVLAAAAVIAAPPGDYVARPQWTRTPSARDVARVQPRDAHRRPVEGESSMVCIITRDGTLERCVVAGESPAGVGLGEAAVRLAPRFRMRRLEAATGRAVEGRLIRIPVTWYP